MDGWMDGESLNGWMNVIVIFARLKFKNVKRKTKKTDALTKFGDKLKESQVLSGINTNLARTQLQNKTHEAARLKNFWIKRFIILESLELYFCFQCIVSVQILF